MPNWSAHCETHKRRTVLSAGRESERQSRSRCEVVFHLHSLVHTCRIRVAAWAPKGARSSTSYTHPKCTPRAQRCHTRTTGRHAHAPPRHAHAHPHETQQQIPGHPIRVRRHPAQFSSTTNHRPQTAACIGLTPGSRSHLAPFHIQGHHRPPAEWQVGLALRAALRLESTSIESSVDLSSSARPTWT